MGEPIAPRPTKPKVSPDTFILPDIRGGALVEAIDAGAVDVAVTGGDEEPEELRRLPGHRCGGLRGAGDVLHGLEILQKLACIRAGREIMVNDARVYLLHEHAIGVAMPHAFR